MERFKKIKFYVLCCLIVFLISIIGYTTYNNFIKNDADNNYLILEGFLCRYLYVKETIFNAYTENDCLEDNHLGYTLKSSSYLEFDDNLANSIDTADLIIRVTVREVGKSYLAEGFVLNEKVSFEGIKENIKGIRTPVTLFVEEIYKGENVVKSDLMTIDRFYGDYNGYSLSSTNAEILLSEGAEYILFIKEIEIEKEKMYFILPQPSVMLNTQKLNPRDFITNYIIDGIDNEIIAEMESAVNHQKGFVSLLLNPFLFEKISSPDELIDTIKRVVQN